MAALDLENLLEKIKHLFFYESTEILVSKEVAEMLENSIRLFKAFLEDNPYIFQDLELKKSYKETVREISKVAWEAADLIDSLVEGEDEIDFSERDTDTRKALHGVAEEAESIAAKVVRIYAKIGAAEIKRRPDFINRKPWVDFQVKREFVVGFEAEEENLIRKFASRIRSFESVKLFFLSDRESWLFFQHEVFGQTYCPSELEDLGQLIVKQCDGLPLAIMMVGGILAHHFSSAQDMDSTRKSWNAVYEQLRMLYRNKDDPLRFLEQIVALSYDILPYHLKACFLYLGIFPKDFEIPVLKLTLLWIAEGFIAPKEGINMEEIAAKYLDELISMKLVRIGKTTIDGKAKTCHIDDIVHAFCQHEAGTIRESISEETKFSRMTTSRRFCIHSDFRDFISSNPCSAQIRSFMFFSKGENYSPSERERISSILTTFKQLRVLEAEIIEFSKLPSDLYQLVHLKYITLSLDSEILPSALSNLRNVQTLIVNTESDTLEIKTDIWSMTHLRHLKSNAPASLPKVRKENLESIKGGEKLQTLGRISPQSCKQEVFDRTRWLKKLTICGRLVILFSKSKTGSIDHLRELHNLEKLKLLNGWGDDELPGLPPPDKFPPRLRSLTLSYTKIDWADMHILGILGNLKVLKLKHKAFKGKVWEVADDGFRRLEVLKIDLTDLTNWVASEHHFPNLRRLELRHCYRLKEVPVELAQIQTFQELGLYKCTTSAGTSARLIRDLKVSKANDFKLCILDA